MPAHGARSSSTAAPLRLDLTVSPEHASMTKPITFDVHVDDLKGHAVNDARVSGTLTMKLMDMGATQLTFEPKGSGNYQASVKGLDMSGPWDLTVSATHGGDNVKQSFDVTVGD
jgi:nitrogen fixation protein FixH